MKPSDEERFARVTLNKISEPGDPRMMSAVADLSGAVVLAGLMGQSERNEFRDDLAQRLAEVEPEVELERAAKVGARFVIPGDDEWPDRVDDLGQGPILHRRGGVPVGLWLRGSQRLDAICVRAVAVVGSRSATSYGASAAGELGAGLASAGQTVVSGAAVGIDQAAHRGALSARGLTIAVLACGVDRAYPAAHERLLDYIAETGLVVSEAPIGGAPTRIRFLARNRLIASLATGTVVVEAAIRSGALNTASWAGGLGRMVMGVPGPITSAPSEGVHQLIRARDALLVTRSEEVLEAISPIGTQTLFDLREEATVRDGLTPDERQVLDAVPVSQAVPLARIARTAGLSPAKVARAIARLDEVGMVEGVRDCWRLARQEALG